MKVNIRLLIAPIIWMSQIRFVMDVSGGHTPWVMLRALATLDMPW
jgi:hypothetical protein